MMRVPRPPFICLQCRLVRRPLSPIRIRTTAADVAAKSYARLFHSSKANFNSNSSEPEPEPSSPIAQQQRAPSSAPRPNIDIKHIRQNVALYEQNCLERNYKKQAAYPARIAGLFAQWQARQREGRGLRERGNALRRHIANPATIQHEDEEEDGNSSSSQTQIRQEEKLPSADAAAKTDKAATVGDVRSMSREQLLEEARAVKQALSAIEEDEARLTTEMSDLALAIPNLTSDMTPRGDEPVVLRYINEHLCPEPSSPVPDDDPDSDSDRVWRSHVHIGSELGILDFAGAATSSGWGWYYLVGEGAQLEQALIQYALSVVTRSRRRPSPPQQQVEDDNGNGTSEEQQQEEGWRHVSPPSIVYSHIASACGFQPRDQNGEQQIYALVQSAADAARGRPELSLAGTAEIPLAALRANSVLERSELPSKLVGCSRCYRAEAGARGADTKGLYRVHEFTKVEMFAWTTPSDEAAAAALDEMLSIQCEILGGLGLRARVLEMPAADLGASARRKVDVEVYFPSRRAKNHGWGEVTSASVCADYQTRRLGTRLRLEGGAGAGSAGAGTSAGANTPGKMVYPWTVNGTAMAVPRVLAALLENHWDENEMEVAIPECLRPWMDGRESIGLKHRRK
ncbi:hypothetical protein F5X99DRAFT_82445 [Biscogniauxia marginata]|nr:hypothetical protein F5X99DRAFT_82445 [Biscogniauxia marginata]